MNERIQQLAKQAYEDVIKNTPSFLVTKELYEQKFAESIVRECIDQVAGTKIVGQFSGDEIVGLSESADKKYAQWNNALVIATMNVRDHFGVEE